MENTPSSAKRAKDPSKTRVFSKRLSKKGMNNSVETINAAATAIVAAESRVQQATIQVDRRIFDQELFFFFFLFSDFW